MSIKITCRIEKITPEQASELLANPWGEQRVFREGHKARLVADMIAGRFLVSPDAILIIKGKLANGQHRLAAVVESGKAQTFIIFESNDEQLYKVVDSGLRRQVKDAWPSHRWRNEMPAIARWVRAYEQQTLYPSTRSPGDHKVHGSVASQSEMIDYCEHNMVILVEAAEFVAPLYAQSRLLSFSIAGAIYVLASSRDGMIEKAKSFLRQVYADGAVNSAAGDLRNRLILNKGSRSKLTHGYIFGLSLKAFRSFANGSRPGSLKWNTNEGIPVL